MSRCILALVALLALAGCAENAILELTVELPDAATAGAPGATFALVQVAVGRSDDPRSLFRVGSTSDASFALSSAPSTERMSVVAGGADLTEPLTVRVVYCRERGCLPRDEDRVAYFEIERAFYQGRYTQVDLLVLTALSTLADPATVTRIERCDVEGCREGNPTTWCEVTLPDAPHFCEQ